MGKVTDECNIVGGSKDSKGVRKFNGRGGVVIISR